MHKALLALLLAACAAKTAPPYHGPPQEITSFSLSRNTLWSDAHPNGKRFILVDAQVVRMLDNSGDEIWGRRLSIGALRSATFCGRGVVVLGEEGAALLNEDGLLQPWRFSNPKPKWATRAPNGECLFDASEGALGAWREGDAWFASDAKSTVTLQAQTLSRGEQWRASTQCQSTCPIALWGQQVVVAEPKKLALFDLDSGARHETEIGLGEGAILSLSVAKGYLLLSRDDGSVQLWQSTPQ